MLKKGKQVMFVKPMSTMRRCLEALEHGNCTIQAIKDATGLKQGQVTAAVYNLRFIGVIERGEWRDGRYMYYIQGRAPVARCLCGVRSIFDVNPLPRS